MPTTRHKKLNYLISISYMTIIDHPTQRAILKDMLPGYFGDMVKAVVDISRKVIGVDAELHADIEQALLETGSKQGDLWGINLYPDLSEEDFIEFDSLINIRPTQGNRSRDVQDSDTREKIVETVNYLLTV